MDEKPAQRDESTLEQLIRAGRPNAFINATEDEVRAWIDRAVAAGRISVDAGMRAMAIKRLPPIEQSSLIEAEYWDFIDRLKTR